MSTVEPLPETTKALPLSAEERAEWVNYAEREQAINAPACSVTPLSMLRYEATCRALEASSLHLLNADAFSMKTIRELGSQLAVALTERDAAICRAGQNALRYERAEAERDGFQDHLIKAQDELATALADCRTLAKLAMANGRDMADDDWREARNRRDFYLKEAPRG